MSAPKAELIVVKGLLGSFSLFAHHAKESYEDLRGEEDHPEVHTLLKALASPDLATA